MDSLLLGAEEEPSLPDKVLQNLLIKVSKLTQFCFDLSGVIVSGFLLCSRKMLSQLKVSRWADQYSPSQVTQAIFWSSKYVLSIRSTCSLGTRPSHVEEGLVPRLEHLMMSFLSAGFCLKTRTDKEEKIFINICRCDQVSPV